MENNYKVGSFWPPQSWAKISTWVNAEGNLSRTYIQQRNKLTRQILGLLSAVFLFFSFSAIQFQSLSEATTQSKMPKIYYQAKLLPIPMHWEKHGRQNFIFAGDVFQPFIFTLYFSLLVWDFIVSLLAIKFQILVWIQFFSSQATAQPKLCKPFSIARLRWPPPRTLGLAKCPIQLSSLQLLPRQQGQAATVHAVREEHHRGGGGDI